MNNNGKSIHFDKIDLISNFLTTTIHKSSISHMFESNVEFFISKENGNKSCILYKRSLLKRKLRILSSPSVADI